MASAWGAEDWSAPLADAQALLAAQDYADAYAAYRKQAEQSNPLAAFTLGLFHELGWGRQRDAVTACRWYEVASKARLPTAQHRLGECLVDGVHGAPDPARAAVLYEDAGRGGHWISLCALGELYQRGVGVAKDPARGVALCEEAAQRGIVKAMRRTALMLLQGDPSTRNRAQGRYWLEQAAARGDSQAQYRLGLAVWKGDGAADQRARARYWLESAAAGGLDAAYVPTAELYLAEPPDPATGTVRPEFLAKAYLWLSAAIRRGLEGDERKRAEAMLKAVMADMPETWQPALDEKVAQHLARSAPEPPDFGTLP
jgi:hypothetical protein